MSVYTDYLIALSTIECGFVVANQIILKQAGSYFLKCRPNGALTPSHIFEKGPRGGVSTPSGLARTTRDDTYDG